MSRSPKEPPSRALGERFAGAFVGAFVGLALGGAITVGLYIVLPAGGIQLHVLWATIAYCALFTFVFGEALGDVMTMIHHIYKFSRGVERYGVPDIDPEASWAGPIVMSIVFFGGLAIVLWLIVK